ELVRAARAPVLGIEGEDHRPATTLGERQQLVRRRAKREVGRLGSGLQRASRRGARARHRARSASAGQEPIGSVERTTRVPAPATLLRRTGAQSGVSPTRRGRRAANVLRTFATDAGASSAGDALPRRERFELIEATLCCGVGGYVGADASRCSPEAGLADQA